MTCHGGGPGPATAWNPRGLGGPRTRPLGGLGGPWEPGRPGPSQPGQFGGTPRSEVGGSDWLACLSHAPAPEPVLGLLRCACRASSAASLADASARSLLLFAAPAARSNLGFRV